MKTKPTWTKVLNLTALVVLGVCMVFHVTYSDTQVGSIALLAWSVINLFTEGGIQHRQLSRTVLTNGIGAILGLVTSIGWYHFTDAQSAQIVLLAFTAANMFTDGGVADATPDPPGNNDKEGTRG